MNDFIQLKPQSNVYEAETMVEGWDLFSNGVYMAIISHYLKILLFVLHHNDFAWVGTLEGFSFGSEDEADKIPKAISHQTDQNEGNGEQTNGKTKAKAEKSSVWFPTFLGYSMYL